PGRGEAVPERDVLREPIGEQVEARSRLLERRPENRGEYEQHGDGDDALPFLRRESPPRLRARRRGRLRLGLSQALERGEQARLADDVLNEAERHADAGAPEADVPVHALAEGSDDERGDES